jgi:hypothetical protein
VVLYERLTWECSEENVGEELVVNVKDEEMYGEDE